MSRIWRGRHPQWSKFERLGGVRSGDRSAQLGRPVGGKRVVATGAEWAPEAVGGREGTRGVFLVSMQLWSMATIDSLPLFPLDLVLYPGERIPLHIFEDRYKELTQYCLDHDVAFGITRSEGEAMADVGTTARIQEVLTQYEDDRLDIQVMGEERFRIVEVHDEKSYYTADVVLVEDDSEPPNPSLKERVITQHMKLLELAGRTVRPDLYKDVDTLSYILAKNAALSKEQKQELLGITSENERMQYLIEHFEALIPRVEQKEDVHRRIRSNGHFKDFPPESDRN